MKALQLDNDAKAAALAEALDTNIRLKEELAESEKLIHKKDEQL